MFLYSTGVQNIESWDVSANNFVLFLAGSEATTLNLDDWQTTINWQSNIEHIIDFTNASMLDYRR